MKKRVLSFFVLSAIALTTFSCSDDDNQAPAEQNKLIGKWDYIEELALDADGNVVSTYGVNNGACPLDMFEFLTNGILKQTDYDYSSNANDCEANDINGTWKIEGETLKLTNDYTNGQEEIFTIKKLDDTSFLNPATFTKRCC